jgi:hypothetical protein
MALYEEFNKGLRDISNTPPEQRAVRSTGALLGNLAKVQSQRQLNDINAGTRRIGTENALSNQRADIRSAKTDVGVALPLTVANVGLQGLSAYERFKAQIEQEKHNRMISDFYTAMGNAMAEDRGKVIEMLSVGINQPLMQEQP